MKKQKENEGSSIVIVIVSMALVGILTTIILMLVVMNYKMKEIDARAKDTFYSAELAMDEIRTGLQNEVSDAFTTGYIDVMQQYTSTTESQRKELFQYTYVNTLRATLKITGNDTKYSLDNLKTYLVKTKLYDSTTKTGVKIEALNNNPLMVATIGGVVLKNLVVTYYEKNEYVSRISTDILLDYPDVDFTQTSSMPNLLQFAIVANSDLSATGATNALIKGSIYGGKNGIALTSGAALEVQSADIAMTNESIQVSGGASFKTDGSTGLWAKNLNVTSGTVEVNGVTHIANDLNITDQSNAASSIKLWGEYYGFGNISTAKDSDYIKENGTILSDIDVHPANYSSAIVVNGRNVTIDMSKLNRVMIAGNAYVATTLKNGSLTGSNTNTADVRMGESLTVKSNQLAYLVPSKYVGVGKINGGMNPMTMTVYNALKAEYAANASIVSTDISTLGANGSETVFYPYAGQTMVYVYLKFATADQASNYFRTYYGANKEKFDKYLKLYTNEIKLNGDSSAKFDLYGNVMRYDGTNVDVKSDTLATGGTSDSSVLAAKQAGMQDMFAALGKKLISNYYELTVAEKAADVFNNLVYQTKLIQYTGTNAGIRSFITPETKLRGVLLNKATVTLTSGNGNDVTNNTTNSITIRVGNENDVAATKMRVVVTTGDVVVDNCTFHGLIIAGGKVTLKGSAGVMAAPEDVAKVLQVKDPTAATGSNMMMNYLINSSEYVLGGAIIGNVNTGNDVNTAISDLVIFKNWKKE
ncbi:MAG: hypothetical protein PHX08_08480 [Lachnospiraceae bacterium]|nr:hypothetical protein [Lachnospiraceae bacterium]